MRKIAYSMIAMAMAAFTFTSCEDVPAPFGQPEDPGTGGGGTEVVEPKGSGTEADPYNVAAAVAAAGALPQITSASDANASNSKDAVAVGYISSIDEIDTSGNYGNATYFISDDKDGKSNKLEIYRGYGLNGQKFNEAGATIIKDGDLVVVSGKLVNFRGTLEFTQGSKILSINGTGGGGTTGDLEGAGTLENPYTAKDAIAIASKMGADDTGSPAYVKGKVVSVTIDTGYGNATYDISADGTEKDQFQIFRGLYFNGENFTSTDQLKKGDDVVVYGNIINFRGNTPEMAQGSQIYSINNQTSGGGEEPSGETIGTQEEPISVTEALVLINALADNAKTDQEAFVKGTIKEIQTSAANIAQYNNIDYIITDGTSEVKVFRGKNLNNTDFTAEGQINVGDEVIVRGKLQKYVKDGNVTPEIAQGNYIVSLTPGQGGGDEPTGDDYGTFENPLTVEEAMGMAADLPEISKAADANESNSMVDAVVKGKIVNIKSIDTGQYGNAEYSISDGPGSNYVLLVYRGYSLNGEHFTSPDEIIEGDEVIVQGTIVNFRGTLEFTSGSKILSINGKTSLDDGGGEQGGGEEAGSITVVTSELGLGNQEKPGTLTLSDGTTLTFDGGGNNNAPAYYNTGNALRMYPKNTMAINAGNKKIASIEISCDEYSGTLYNASGDITVNGTKMTIDGTNLKFSGPNASSATVANTSETTGAQSQLRMKTLTITYAK